MRVICSPLNTEFTEIHLKSFFYPTEKFLMPIIFRVKDKVFKCPDRIVVGRGAPFSVFDGNWGVARAHLLIEKKKNQIRVKPLNRKLETSINEKLAKPGKFINVSETDNISIGGELIQFISDELGDEGVISIEKTTSLPINTAFKLYFIIIYLILVGFIFYDNKFSFFSFISCLFVSFLLWGGFSWIIKFYEKLAAPSMKEIYISPEGFTVHFSDQQTMSFKTQSIQSWFHSKRGKTLFVTAHDEEYVLNTFGNFQSLVNYLRENVPEKEIDSKKLEKNWMILFLFLILGFVSNSLISIFACLLVSMVCIGMVVSPGLRRFWPGHVTKVYSKRKQLISIMLLGLITGFIGIDKYFLRQNEQVLSSCLSGNKNVCHQINFRKVDADEFNSKGIYQETLRLACDEKNKTACKKLKKLGKK